ncbi:MAG: glycosyltransferase family 39 protein, partial [Anaerolineales bacterium]|nr:glycosyltransferase family 39 protein [Anaerolineales bacterium]
DHAALALFVAALGVWLFALLTSPLAIGTRLDGAPSAEEKPRPASRTFILSAFALAALTFLFSSGNEFTPDNVLAWLLSIAVFLYAFWIPGKTWDEWLARLTSARKIFAEGARVSPSVVALIGVMVIGVVTYYRDLDATPVEMTSDHAEKLLDVNDIVNGGLAPIFFERNTGREPLQFYLTAAFVNLTQHPIDHMALKLITALMGVLVIPFTFLFARELFDDDVALFAALLIAISKWPLTMARMGLRFPFTPVFIAPTMFFLFRALKYGRRNDFLMTGLFLGLGLLGYNAFRLAPILVIVFVIVWWWTRRMSLQQTKTLIVNSALLFTLALFVVMPLARYMTEKPEMVWYRAVTRLVGDTQPIPGDPVEIFARNSVKAALMFNWTSDAAWPNALPNDPALDYVSGGLFILGVAYALYRLARYRENVYAFVLGGIALMLLPSTLSLAFPNENPSVVRAGGAIPFVFIVVALPLAWLMRSWRESLARFRWGKFALVAVLVLLFALIGRANYMRYFLEFDANYRRASWNSSEVAAVIRGFADSVGDVEHAWILLYPHWIDTRNVGINLGQPGWERTLSDADAARAHASEPTHKLYLLHPNDHANLARLREIFPNGQQRVFHARTPGHDFIVFYVPGAIAPGEVLESK